MQGVRLICGDALRELRKLRAGSVQCCVTSPPYWSQRDYGGGTWVGGDAACDHVVGQMRLGISLAKSPASCRGGAKKVAEIPPIQARRRCPCCGARRVNNRQIGLEDTPDEYIRRLVRVFREVRRVLRSDGTFWLNMGDTYDSKQLCGIPWRLALALQADGWILRQDIIWHKPNPMPNSVRDRCVTAHEYLFLFAKSRRYFWNYEAMREKAAYAGVPRGGSRRRYHQRGADNKLYDKRTRRSVWKIGRSSFRGAHFATFPPQLVEPCILAGCRRNFTVLDPFAGSGTVGLVAHRLGRKAILIDLMPEYIEMMKRRIADDR